MQEIVEKIKEHAKGLSFKRILVLSAFMLVITGVAFLSVLVSAGDSMALSSLKSDTLASLLKEKGQNLDDLFTNKFSEVCKRDKELGYIYLRKKLEAKEVGVVLYTVEDGENYWTVAKKFGINIDTIIGANPELEDLKAQKGKQLIILSKKGCIHSVADRDENLDLLAQLYKIDKEKIKKANGIAMGGIKVGDLLFIPGAKPVYMSESLQKLFAKRSMFRSPLSGVYTSLFGLRVHPVTGEELFHAGVDIRADIGSWVAAAADGVVVFAGWENHDHIGRAHV